MSRVMELAHLRHESFPIMVDVIDWFRSQSAAARAIIPPEIEAKLEALDQIAMRRQVALALARDEAERPVPLPPEEL